MAGTRLGSTASDREPFPSPIRRSSPIRVPVIIEAAINGMTERGRNPHVPLLPEEISRDTIACVEAGAAIVHSHIDLPNASPAEAAQRYLEGWSGAREQYRDLILYPTLGSGASLEERYGHHSLLAERGAIRMGVVDPGCVNLGGADDDGLPAPARHAYVNTFSDIRYVFSECERLGLGPSIAIYEPGFLRVALAYQRAGRMPPGAMVKLYFGGEYGYSGWPRRGISFGLPPTVAALEAYLEMIGDSGLVWSAAVMGGSLRGRSGTCRARRGGTSTSASRTGGAEAGGSAAARGRGRPPGRGHRGGGAHPGACRGDVTRAGAWRRVAGGPICLRALDLLTFRQVRALDAG